jgi:hypothetical protein
MTRRTVRSLVPPTRIGTRRSWTGVGQTRVGELVDELAAPEPVQEVQGVVEVAASRVEITPGRAPSH